TESPQNNTAYEARSGKRHSALLFVGVRDVVSVTPSATTAHVGDVVSFSGSVLPNKAGHVIYLEQRGDDGAFHVVQVRTVRADSIGRSPPRSTSDTNERSILSASTAKRCR